MQHAWLRLPAVLLILTLAAPLMADEHGKDMKGDDTEASTKEEAAEARPERRHIRTYRERINRITREPLRKEIPEPTHRTPEDRQWRGIRDARPIIARKRTFPRHPKMTRWDHVKQVARGPITRPPEEDR